MAKSKFANHDTPCFQTEMGGRLLPGRTDATQKAEQPSYSAQELEDSIARLSESLLLISRAHIGDANAIQNGVTMKEVIESYASQIGRVEGLCDQWKAFLRSLVVMVSGDFAQSLESPNEVNNELQLWREELMAESKIDALYSVNTLTAQMAAEPLQQLKQKLTMHIDQSIKIASKRMMEQLVDMVGLQVIGVVEWFDSDKCTYSRYERQCDYLERRKQFVSSEVEFANESRKYQRRTKSLLEGKTKRSLLRTIQHLVHAKQCSIGHSSVVVPREITQLIDETPTWLKSSLRIVEGMLIREIVVEQDLGVKEFSVLVDEVQWHNDPALVLGPFVLRGWGEKEIRHELAWQTEEAPKVPQVGPAAAGPTHWPWNKTLGVVLLALGCLLATISLGSALNMIAALTFGWVAAVFLGNRWEVTQQNQTALDEESHAGTMAVLAVSAALLAAVCLSLGFIPFAIILATAGIFCFRMYVYQTADWNVPESAKDK